MNQVLAVPISSGSYPVGTGGFLNPDRIVDELHIQEGMQIADFGSGSGYFTISMGERVKAGVKNLENIETIRADLEVLGSSSLPDNSQDIVLLANILFQSDKKAEIFKEAMRILKKEGTMIVIDWKKGTGSFGPPDGRRTDDLEMISMAEKSNFKLKSKLDAGQFHYGLIFTTG